MIDDILSHDEKGRKLSEIAKRIRKARESAHLSQESLGRAIGVSDKSVSAYEQGRSTPPLNKLKKLAEVTDHPVSYFTEENNIQEVIANKLILVSRLLQEVRTLLHESKDQSK